MPSPSGPSPHQLENSMGSPLIHDQPGDHPDDRWDDDDDDDDHYDDDDDDDDEDDDDGDDTDDDDDLEDLAMTVVLMSPSTVSSRPGLNSMARQIRSSIASSTMALLLCSS